jgi:hypothetical protein
MPTASSNCLKWLKRLDGKAEDGGQHLRWQQDRCRASGAPAARFGDVAGGAGSSREKAPLS